MLDDDLFRQRYNYCNFIDVIVGINKQPTLVWPCLGNTKWPRDKDARSAFSIITDYS